MPVALRNPNPLGFPGGILPGLDRTHPAAGAITRFSTVNVGGFPVNLVNGTLWTLAAGTATAGIQGRIGPWGLGAGTAGSPATTYFTQSLGTQTDTNATVGAIFYVPGVTGSTTYLIDNSTGIGLRINSTTSVVLTKSEASTTAWTIPSLVNNNPYFLAASVFLNASGTVNYVLVDLLTGKTVSTSAAQAKTPSAANATWQIYSTATDAGQNRSIACLMQSNAFLSVPQLLQWATDPWAFWYPRRQLYTVGATAAAFKAYWAANTNLPVLGTGTY